MGLWHDSMRTIGARTFGGVLPAHRNALPCLEPHPVGGLLAVRLASSPGHHGLDCHGLLTHTDSPSISLLEFDVKIRRLWSRFKWRRCYEGALLASVGMGRQRKLFCTEESARCAEWPRGTSGDFQDDAGCCLPPGSRLWWSSSSGLQEPALWQCHSPFLLSEQKLGFVLCTGRLPSE